MTLTGSSSIGALTVSAGSSLTISAAAATAGNPTADVAAVPSLTISSGLQNSGSLTVAPPATSGHPALSLSGPVTNSGTITVDGTMAHRRAPRPPSCRTTASSASHPAG